MVTLFLESCAWSRAVPFWVTVKTCLALHVAVILGVSLGCVTPLYSTFKEYAYALCPTVAPVAAVFVRSLRVVEQFYTSAVSSFYGHAAACGKEQHNHQQYSEH